MIVIFCLHISKSINSCDDLRRIFSKAVQDDAKRFLADFIRLLSNTDRSFRRRE